MRYRTSGTETIVKFSGWMRSTSPSRGHGLFTVYGTVSGARPPSSVLRRSFYLNLQPAPIVLLSRLKQARRMPQSRRFRMERTDSSLTFALKSRKPNLMTYRYTISLHSLLRMSHILRVSVHIFVEFKSNQIFIWIRQKPIHTDTHTNTQNTIYNKRRNYETRKKTRPVNDMQYNEIIKSQVMQLMNSS